MPNKAIELCDAIKSVQKLAEEILGGEPWISTGGIRDIKVLVNGIRNLEQIPGDIIFEESGRETFPWRVHKMFEGVEFYKLLTQKEYEAASAPERREA